MLIANLNLKNEKVLSMQNGFLQAGQFERSFQCFRWCNTLLSYFYLSIYYYYYACVCRGSSKTPLEIRKKHSGLNN